MEQSELLQIAVSAMESLRLRYFVTGSVATVFYGEPRFTNDIDIVLDLHAGRVDAFCSRFPLPEFYVSADAAQRAVAEHGQFNIIHPASGLKIDLMIPAPGAFNDSRFERAVRVHATPSTDVVIASPEDVILKKLQYFAEGGSDKHLRDINGVLRVSGSTLDREYIQRWASRLGVKTIWDRLLLDLGESQS